MCTFAVFPLNTVCGVYSVKSVDLVCKHMTSLFLLFLCYHSKIHILGSFQNIKVARNAICSLILGKLGYLIQQYDAACVHKMAHTPHGFYSISKLAMIDPVVLVDVKDTF